MTEKERGRENLREWEWEWECKGKKWERPIVKVRECSADSTPVHRGEVEEKEELWSRVGKLIIPGPREQGRNSVNLM